MPEHDPQFSSIVRVLPPRDARCPACRYSLRDIVAATCPECGETIEAWVRHQPLTRAEGWLLFAGTVALYACALGLLPLLLLLTEPLPLRRGDWWGITIGACCTIGGAALGVLLLRLSSRRKSARLARWEPASDWLAALTVVLALAPFKCRRKPQTNSRGRCTGCSQPLQLRLRSVQPIHFFDPRRPELALAIIAPASSIFHTALKAPILIMMHRAYGQLTAPSPAALPPEAEAQGRQLWIVTGILVLSVILCSAVLALLTWNRRCIVRWPRPRRIALAAATVALALAPWLLLAYLEPFSSAKP